MKHLASEHTKTVAVHDCVHIFLNIERAVYGRMISVHRNKPPSTSRVILAAENPTKFDMHMASIQGTSQYAQAAPSPHDLPLRRRSLRRLTSELGQQTRLVKLLDEPFGIKETATYCNIF